MRKSLCGGVAIVVWCAAIMTAGFSERAGSGVLVAAQLPAEPAPKEPPALSADHQKLLESGTPLNPQKTVFLDKKNGRLFLKTCVCLREGLLEMFLCKSRTKEHESILTIDSDAYVIHAGLLALGANAGQPVRFVPEFSPPQGDRIEIWVNWTDADGKQQRTQAQKWVRSLTRRYFVEKIGPLPNGIKLPRDPELKYIPEDGELVWFGIMTDAQRDTLLALSSDETYQNAIRKMHRESQPRTMDADFIFGGSGFHIEKDGSKWYQAEGGNLICVANFGDAMIDVSVRSSDVNAEASFEPDTDRVPPLGTPVVVELIPVRADAKD
jgi:hypothetical protein